MARRDGGIDTVLVVEDEPKIRAIIAEALREDARRVLAGRHWPRGDRDGGTRTAAN